MKEYREKPGAYRIEEQGYHQTLRFKARVIFGLFRSYHHDWSDAELREAATGRLLDQHGPYRPALEEHARQLGYTLEATARELIEPRKPASSKPKGGRPPNERRHRLIQDLKATWPRSERGQKLRKGFWDAAAVKVSQVEGKPISGYELKVDHYRHLKTCKISYAVVAGGQPVRTQHPIG